MAAGIGASVALPQTVITWLFSNSILNLLRKTVVTTASRYLLLVSELLGTRAIKCQIFINQPQSLAQTKTQS